MFLELGMTAIVHSPEELFLRSLFAQFEESDVRYGVMRNYESLPNSTGGSDLDLLIDSGQRGLAIEAVDRALDAAGGVVIGRAATVGFVKIYAFGRPEDDDHEWWGIRIDVLFGVIFKGAAPLVAESVLRTRCERHNGVRVFPKDLAAVVGVVKEMLHNRIVPSRYRSDAERALSERWDQMCADLEPMGLPALEILKEACSGDSQPADLDDMCRRMQRLVLGRAFSKSSVAWIAGRIRHRFSKVWRYLRPSGVLVGLVGSTAAGRESLLSELKPVLLRATHGDLVISSGPAGCPPSSGDHEGRSDSAADRNRHDGTLASLKRVMRAVIVYWGSTRLQVAKCPTVVICNGYSHNIAEDWAGGDAWVAIMARKLAACLVPKADVKVVMGLGNEGGEGSSNHRKPIVYLEAGANAKQSRDAVLTVLRTVCRRRSAAGRGGA